MLCEKFRQNVEFIQDLPRIMGRIALPVAGVNDLIALRESLESLQILPVYFSELNSPLLKEIAEKFNQSTTIYFSGDKTQSKNELIEIIKSKDSTYSPLALYFLIDNKIETSNDVINNYFDVLIKEVKFDKEIKNLIIISTICGSINGLSDGILMI